MTSRPNFLFLFPDQHRFDWLGPNPDLPLRTPNIDWLAERGTRFLNAYTPSPLCSPARACLATGRDYQHCGVRNNGQNTPLELPNYYRNLRNSGYEVSGVGKFDLHKPDLEWGIEGKNKLSEYGFSRGIDNEGKGDAIWSYLNSDHTPQGPYMQFLVENDLAETHVDMYRPHRDSQNALSFAAVTELPDHAYCDNWVAEKALSELRSFSSDRPWHLVVNFVGPHDPFDVTPSMRREWEGVDFPDAVDSDEGDPTDIRVKRQNYAAMIENIDSQIGRMINLVRERGELENTIIVYASDHGEMLGDHERWAKSVWYEASVHVPLIVSGPQIREGAASDALVSLHDLAATFLDYGQAEALPDSDARSLRSVLEGSAETHREHVVSGLNDWTMVFDGQHKLVLGSEPEPILYDLQADPNELENCASRHPEIVARLQSPL